MVKSSRIFSSILLFSAAASFLLLFAVGRMLGEMESMILRELNIIVYVDAGASADDINNLEEKFNNMAEILVKDFTSSAAALELLREDSVIAAELDAIERDFLPPNNFVLIPLTSDTETLKKAAEDIRSMAIVEFVDFPSDELSGASRFLERVEVYGLLLQAAFAAAALLLIFFSSIIYFRVFSERVEVGVDMGASFFRIASKGISRQFLCGLLSSAAASLLFYIGENYWMINIFSGREYLQSVIIISVLAPFVFSLVSAMAVKKARI